MMEEKVTELDLIEKCIIEFIEENENNS